jgi:hypothetical protein
MGTRHVNLVVASSMLIAIAIPVYVAVTKSVTVVIAVIEYFDVVESIII